jgi:hypothetical protein
LEDRKRTLQKTPQKRRKKLAQEEFFFLRSVFFYAIIVIRGIYPGIIFPCSCDAENRITVLRERIVLIYAGERSVPQTETVLRRKRGPETKRR